MGKIPFIKMNGCGNDFIVVDNRKGILKDFDLPRFIRRVCVRRVSLGADGFISLEKSEYADFTMRYYNSDGSEGEMCGNGARCIAKFAQIIGAADAAMRFETRSGFYEAWITGENVQVKFPFVNMGDITLNQSYNFDGDIIKFHYAKVGVPHVAIYRDDVSGIDDKKLCTFGRKIRYSDIFCQGTNVNFIQIIDNNNIIIRTYERGVEDETLACGTGSTASAIISGLLSKVRPPVSMHTRAGILKISYRLGKDRIEDIYMEGDVQAVAEGYILPAAYKVRNTEREVQFSGAKLSDI